MVRIRSLIGFFPVRIHFSRIEGQTLFMDLNGKTGRSYFKGNVILFLLSGITMLNNIAYRFLDGKKHHCCFFILTSMNMTKLSCVALKRLQIIETSGQGQ
jgi:hypothetical protein